MAGNRTNSKRGGANNTTGTTKAQRRKARNGGGGGGGAPTSVGTGYIAQGPAVIGSTNRIAKFTNTEFVTDISAPNVGNQTPVLWLSLNPSNAGFTPWLSRIAVGYEFYRFRRLSVIYTPTCSTSTAGVVVMAIDYDASDAAPLTKQALSGYEGAVRSSVWNKVTLQATPPSGWYYCGAGSPSNPSNTDVKMYDFGKLYVGVYNQTASGPVGELSVSYDVEFSKPDSGGSPGLSERIAITGSSLATMTGTSAITGNSIFSVLSAGSGVSTLLATVAGDFLIEIAGSYGSGSSTLPANNPFTSVAQTDPGSAPINVPWVDYLASGTTSGYFIVATAVSVIPGSSLSITTLGIVTAITLYNMRISSYRKALG